MSFLASSINKKYLAKKNCEKKNFKMAKTLSFFKIIKFIV